MMDGLIPSRRSSVEGIVRTREGQIFSVGFFLFGFAFVLDGVSDLLTQVPSFASNAESNVLNWSLFLAFGILSVAGLMIMPIFSFPKQGALGLGSKGERVGR